MEDKKTEKIKDDNLNLSFVKISKNLNLGQLKKNTFRASASRAKNPYFSGSGTKIKNLVWSLLYLILEDRVLPDLSNYPLLESFS